MALPGGLGTLSEAALVWANLVHLVPTPAALVPAIEQALASRPGVARRLG